MCSVLHFEILLWSTLCFSTLVAAIPPRYKKDDMGAGYCTCTPAHCPPASPWKDLQEVRPIIILIDHNMLPAIQALSLTIMAGSWPYHGMPCHCRAMTLTLANSADLDSCWPGQTLPLLEYQPTNPCLPATNPSYPRRGATLAVAMPTVWGTSPAMAAEQHWECFQKCNLSLNPTRRRIQKNTSFETLGKSLSCF